ELARVKLFFASDDGTQLIAAYREKHYSSNTPIERFIVEELIAGPSGQVDGLNPTINPNTKIINVTTKDGICYVNLDENFLTVPENVSMEAAVYSMVNSLVELSNINKVQILVNGEVPTTSSIFQSSTFERNLDLVTSLKN
ncbi:MAG: GerMN domain-containing protein, partial [Acetatifactor sp.]|nr:GerMN domain-containing protein [Acetatifactor sp.]